MSAVEALKALASPGRDAMEVTELLDMSERGQFGDTEAGLGAVLAADGALDWSRERRRRS